MLAQLADAGLATFSETRSDGGRVRKVYEITDAGREALDAWLREPTTPRPTRDERLLKLFFGARADLEVSIASIERHRDALRDRREHYGEIRDRLEAVKDAPPDQRFWLMTLRQGDLEVEANLRWCDEVLAELRSMEPVRPEDPS